MEKHRLGDRCKRFTSNKEGKPPFVKRDSKDKETKRFDKKDFKGKKINAIGIEGDDELLSDDKPMEPEYENIDDIL